MKSVLVLTGIYPPDIGGPATFVPTLEEFLARENWVINTITLGDSQAIRRLNHGLLFRISRHGNMLVRVFKVVIKGLIVGHKCDLIFANGLHEEAAIIAMLIRKPLIMKVVGDPIWEKSQRSQNHGDSRSFELSFVDWKRHGYSVLFRIGAWKFSLRRAKMIITPSNELKRHLLLYGLKSPIEVIPNGTTISYLPEPNYRFDVISLSRLVPWKNIDVLIRAATQYGFTLGIYGDGPEYQDLVRLAEGHSNIVFCGSVGKEQVPQVLAGCRVFALVSSYEGLSFSLIEALANAKPCVVSNAQGNLDVIGHSGAGAIVPIGDIQATGMAIRGILDNAAHELELSQSARKLAEEAFDENDQLRKVLRVFENVAKV